MPTCGSRLPRKSLPGGAQQEARQLRSRMRLTRFNCMRGSALWPSAGEQACESRAASTSRLEPWLRPRVPSAAKDTRRQASTEAASVSAPSAAVEQVASRWSGLMPTLPAKAELPIPLLAYKGPELERGSSLYTPPDPTTTSTGMSVTWLGTSSGAPTRRRNVSSIALRTQQQTLLVDCGEATNRQIVVAGIHPLSISNVFITHMHGDHCFGLIGVLTMISEARAGTPLSQRALRVFGPPGIQHLVASTLRFSSMQLAMPLIVAEFAVQPELSSPPRPVPSLPGVSFAVLAPDHTDMAKRALSTRPRRADVRDIHEIDVVDGLIWTIPCEHDLTVQAAQLQHRVPCWGYVMKEADSLPTEKIEAVLEVGLQPGTALACFRNGMGPSDDLLTPSGRNVPLRALLSRPAAGRKVVLLGDTCNSQAIAEAGKGADLLSHEATFSSNMSSKAFKAQHSTAAMAGAFARSIGAAALVLTHFSGRYAASRGKVDRDDGDTSDATVGDIQSLLDEARSAFKGPVYPAQDFFTYEVLDRRLKASARQRSQKGLHGSSQQAGASRLPFRS